MLDFRVKTFLAVCRNMSYSRTAEELHITQPAVSQHIKYLELYYGVKLFRYEGRRLSLTGPGMALREYLGTMENDEQHILELFRAPQKKKEQLHFGVTRTIGEYVIAAPLSRLLRQRPDMDVRMEIDNTAVLLDHLDSGKIQFALVEGNFDHSRYEWLLFSSEPYIPICACSHQFAFDAKDRSLLLRDLTGEPLLVREPGSGTREILEQQLASHGLAVSDFARTAQIGGMHTILQMVEMDAGITFLYRSAAEKSIEAGLIREIPLKDFTVVHDFTFIWKKDSLFAEEIREKCEVLTKENI